jgi:prophage regulatory protein
MKRSTIYRRIANEKFPKPVKLGVNIVAWPESAVNAWMDGVMSGSVTEPAKGE